MPDVVPLPAHLETCGCPNATLGRHYIECVPAREYRTSPLTAREGYAPGTRFRGISWDYPLTFSVNVDVDVSIDPVAFIKARLDEYVEFTPHLSYQLWEKPLVFLHQVVEEEAQGLEYALPGFPTAETRVTTDGDSRFRNREYKPWDEEDTATLHTALGLDEAGQRLPDPGPSLFDPPEAPDA